MQTIIDLDEEENERLALVIALTEKNPSLKITLGIWIAKGYLTWASYQLFSLQFGCLSAVRKDQQICSDLLDKIIKWMTIRHPAEDAMFLWKAQQQYRILLAFYSKHEQLEVAERFKI